MVQTISIVSGLRDHNRNKISRYDISPFVRYVQNLRRVEQVVSVPIDLREVCGGNPSVVVLCIRAISFNQKGNYTTDWHTKQYRYHEPYIDRHLFRWMNVSSNRSKFKLFFFFGTLLHCHLMQLLMNVLWTICTQMIHGSVSSRHLPTNAHAAMVRKQTTKDTLCDPLLSLFHFCVARYSSVSLCDIKE